MILSSLVGVFDCDSRALLGCSIWTLTRFVGLFDLDTHALVGLFDLDTLLHFVGLIDFDTHALVEADGGLVLVVDLLLVLKPADLELRLLLRVRDGVALKRHRRRRVHRLVAGRVGDHRRRCGRTNEPESQ